MEFRYNHCDEVIFDKLLEFLSDIVLAFLESNASLGSGSQQEINHPSISSFFPLILKYIQSKMEQSPKMKITFRTITNKTTY